MLAPAVNTTRRVPLYSPFSPALQGALDFHLGTAEPRPRSPKKPTAPRRPVAHAFRLLKFLRQLAMSQIASIHCSLAWGPRPGPTALGRADCTAVA